MPSICLVYFFFFFFLSCLTFSFGIYFLILDSCVMLEFEIMKISSGVIYMSVLLDWMSLLFMSFVLFISSMVIYYSMEYMDGDLNINRFIILVVMFVFSMMLLIISPNLVSILLGWDGLGLVSYCLVIYYQNFKSYNAGMLTALSNRIGDVALLLSIAWMLNYGSWNFIYYLDFMKFDFHMQVISFLVILAAMTKSAQIPFSSWLPAAMAAPTPVSSLVHSSTLVTAGVYLLIRFFNCFSSSSLFILLLLSSLTMFMAGLGANYEFDLKKIIALSTLSQLGLMMSVLCMGDNILAFFHLLTHALFKALLFMCAGSMIHNLGNCQDIRFMGGFVQFMPLTCCMFVLANMALCGLPFLAGFYSKDLILESISMGYSNFFIYLLFFISTGLTVCYTFRLLYYTVLGDFNFYGFHMVGEEGRIMLKGMLGLIFMVIFGGSILSWMIFPIPYLICLPLVMKIMTLIVIVLGGWLGYELSKFSLNYNLFSFSWLLSSLFFSSMWNMPFLSTFGVNFVPLSGGGASYKIIDLGWSEYFGAQNIFKNMVSYTLVFQNLFIGNLKILLTLFLIWIVFLIILF